MRDNNVLITIAIPVYNVDKYISRCLDSLLNQDLYQCEILLVNDGSTDSSLKLCQEYETKNECVRLINQENHGLAYVRNICIKQAQGDYISFVDSDDFIVDGGAYAHFKKIIKEYMPDIIVYGCINEYGEVEGQYNYNNNSEVITEYTAQEAIDSMFIDPNIEVITCNKVIKKELFQDIQYPVGKLYEDMFTNYKVIAKAHKIISTSNKYYVYCHRSDSIGTMNFSEKTMDLYKAATEVHEFGLNFCSEVRNLNVGYLHWLIVVVNAMIRSNMYDLDYIKKVQIYAKHIYDEIIKNECINTTRKIQMILFSISFTLYKLMYRIYIKKNRNY